MRLRANGLVIFLLVAVIVFTSAYIIFGQKNVAEPETNTKKFTIEVNKPITMAQCQGCHGDLDTFSKLRFDHWIHFKKGLKCTVCHDQWPHQQGKIILPKKETCFGCHGLKHGKQGLLASLDCKTCHEDNFNRRPANHNQVFVKKDHKKKSGGKCLMCHEVKQCRTCHSASKVKMNYSTLKFNATQPKAKAASFDIIVIEELAKPGTCFNCHFDLNANQVKGLRFDHWPHFKKGVQCTTCHSEQVHEAGKINTPKMDLCFRCHGLEHNKQGKVAPNNCATCHKADFNLKPKWHGKNWIKVHKKKVFEDVTYIKYKTITSITSLSCNNCHEKSFCQNCHNERKQKPSGFIPPQKRKTRHEKAHYQKDKLCDACHDRATFCQKCHKVEMPHEYNWMETHQPQVKVKRKDCGTCHKQTLFCNSCHHSGVKPKLTAKVCNQCHDDFMKLKQSTLVERGQKAAADKKPEVARQYRRFVYHKVHFPKNYACTKCHQTNFKLKGKVFELCSNRGCHPPGQKKPLSGATLCRKCHIEPHRK